MDAKDKQSELVRFDDRSQWLDGRACSIGSSDAAVVLGYGYAGSSLVSLWAEKAHGHRAPIDESTLKMFAKGHAAEPYIAKLCEIDHGWDIQFDPPYTYRRNKERPHLTASLDAWMIEDDQPVAVEFKNLSMWGARDWDPSSGKAPLKYTIQVQHQLAVTGWSKGYLVGLIGFDTYVIPVPRHDGLIAGMLQMYEQFWECVVQKREPKIDDSKATAEALARVYPPKRMETLHLDDELEGMVDLYFECDEEANEKAKLRDRTLNELVPAVGAAELLVTSDGRWFSFKKGRGKSRVLKPFKGKVV